MQMTLLLENLRTYAPLSLPRQSLQDVLVSMMGNRGAVLQVKVAVAPESVPRLGARAALEIPPISVEVHLGKAIPVRRESLFSDVFFPDFGMFL
jgi:hypothetical protein